MSKTIYSRSGPVYSRHGPIYGCSRFFPILLYDTKRNRFPFILLTFLMTFCLIFFRTPSVSRILLLFPAHSSFKSCARFLISRRNCVIILEHANVHTKSPSQGSTSVSVAQGIEQRFPKPCAACSNHARDTRKPAGTQCSRGLFHLVVYVSKAEDPPC